MVLTRLHVFLAHLFGDDTLACTQAELAQVNAVGTHVSDASILVEVLRHHHGLSYSKA